MTAGFDVSDVYIVRLVDSQRVFRQLSAYKSVGQKQGFDIFLSTCFFFSNFSLKIIIIIIMP